MLHTTNFPTLKLFRRGKVRDVYDLGDTLLMVATDRISAFDVIMDEPIPNKGKILSNISLFWFNRTAKIVRNHVISTNVDDFPEECQPYRSDLEGRSMWVKKTQPIPIECVVRGYLAGSGWKEYAEHGTVAGVPLKTGFLRGSRLAEPIFSPATKAETGHDENITWEQAAEIVGESVARKLETLSLKLYYLAQAVTEERGLIVADTKFEFGIDTNGEIILIDEALTPDSSRFWLRESWSEGTEPVNFDKQVLRDYLETLDWNKQYPPPPLPPTIIEQTLAKYQEAERLILGTLDEKL